MTGASAPRPYERAVAWLMVAAAATLLAIGTLGGLNVDDDELATTSTPFHSGTVPKLR